DHRRTGHGGSCRSGCAWRWSSHRDSRRNCGDWHGHGRRRSIAFKYHLNRTHAHDLAGQQAGFLDWRAIDKSAVGGTKISDHDSAAVDENLAMRTGDRGIFELEIIGKSTTEIILACLELDLVR